MIRKMETLNITRSANITSSLSFSEKHTSNYFWVWPMRFRMFFLFSTVPASHRAPVFLMCKMWPEEMEVLFLALGSLLFGTDATTPLAPVKDFIFLTMLIVFLRRWE